MPALSPLALLALFRADLAAVAAQIVALYPETAEPLEQVKYKLLAVEQMIGIKLRESQSKKEGEDGH